MGDFSKYLQITWERMGNVWGPKVLVSMTAWVVKLAAEVELFIALVATVAGVDEWNVALADEMRALGDGAGRVGGRPGEPLPRRPWIETSTFVKLSTVKLTKLMIAVFWANFYYVLLCFVLFYTVSSQQFYVTNGVTAQLVKTFFFINVIPCWHDEQWQYLQTCVSADVREQSRR